MKRNNPYLPAVIILVAMALTVVFMASPAYGQSDVCEEASVVHQDLADREFYRDHSATFSTHYKSTIYFYRHRNNGSWQAYETPYGTALFCLYSWGRNRDITA